MKKLKDTTIIIPVAIESTDRLNNAKTVLGFLNYHFNVNVIIHELVKGETKLDFLGDYKNLRINHIIEQNDLTTYHRTRQLNEMLNKVTTKVVVNYDIDVLLPVETYIEAEKMIILGKSDVVYPYGNGLYQKRIFTKFNRERFDNVFDFNLITEGDYDIWYAKYGHCVFLNTSKYRRCGGENEGFIAYGPEDSERYERFVKIGYKVDRVNDIVYHLEHSRTSFSDNTNHNFKKNDILYEKLSKMTKDEIIDYYYNIEYKNKYKAKNKWGKLH